MTYEPNLARSSRATPWVISLLLLLATFLNYMDRQVLAVTLPKLKADYHLTEDRIGLLEGCFGFSFAFGSIFFGLLVDRLGPRLLYPGILAGWSLAGILTAGASLPQYTTLLASSGDSNGTGVFRWLLVCRVLLGFFEAGHWPCALWTIRSILPPRDRTFGNGLLQSGASLGAIAVPLYVELAERSGQSWSFSFWSLGIAGLAWIPLWLVFMRAVPAPSPIDRVTVEPHHSTGDPRPFLRRMLALAIVIGTLNISWQFLRAWIVLFLQDYHGYSDLKARGLMSGYFIASDVGCILSGLLVTMLVDRQWSVHHARVLGFVIFTILTAGGSLIPYVGNGPLMIVLLYITGAGILGLHPYYYSFAQEVALRKTGAATGFLAAFGWVASSVANIVLGQQIKATESYALGLTIVGLAPMIGLAALLLLWGKVSQAQTLQADSR